MMPIFIKRAYYVLFLAFLAILPVSGTIALRNLILILLLVLLLVSVGVYRSALAIKPSEIWRRVPWSFKCLAVFLLLFPLWAVQQEVALQNLGGQWVELILSALIGWGAVMLLGQRGPGLLALGAASSLPLVLHLLLFLAGLAGLLSPAFYADPSLGTVWQSLRDHGMGETYQALHLHDLFAGFRGVEPMHGNLGYPGDQAISLFCACLAMGWLGSATNLRWKPFLGIAICLLSVFVAQSRGGILYSFLLLLLAGATYWLKMRTKAGGTGLRPGGARQALVMGGLALIGVLLLAGIAVQSVRNDSRWKTMADKVSLGLQYENPVQLLCDGPSAEYEAGIRQKFADNPQYAEDVINGLKVQDGGRILLMRVASQMVLENGRGLDGSRQSFKKLIAKKCGHVPVLDFAHSHQGWLDLALALGWLGLALFATVMLSFLRRGWRSLGEADLRPWAFALFLVSAFWISRGFADSIYREHNLEMQFLVMSYLYARMVFSREIGVTSARD